MDKRKSIQSSDYTVVVNSNMCGKHERFLKLTANVGAYAVAGIGGLENAA